jgi:hypothetical protein
MSEQNQAAWTFGLFIRVVQTWCTSLEEQTTQEFPSSVPGRSLEVFGSRRPSPYFDHVSSISLRHLDSVVKTEDISIFFWKFCLLHLHCIVFQKCGQSRGKPENKDTCDVCLFFPHRLIDAVTTKIFDLLASEHPVRDASIKWYPLSERAPQQQARAVPHVVYAASHFSRTFHVQHAIYF